MSVAPGRSADSQSSLTRRVIIPGIVIGGLGALVSAYSVWHHLRVRLEGVTDAACNLTQTLNCDAVASSQYSEVFGTPLGAWGLGYFLAMICLLLALKAKPVEFKYLLNSWGTLVMAGAMVSIVLGGISVFVLKSLCPTCLVVYGLCAAQVIVFFLNKERLSKNPDGKIVLGGLIGAMVPVALAVSVYEAVEPSVSSKVESEITLDASNGLAPTFYDIPINRSAYSGLGEDYRTGSDEAKVVIVEFSDFQCPSCMRMSIPLKQLQAEFRDQVQIVYKNYPLDKSCNSYMPGPMHKFACHMAAAARCAGEQGKFWEYHDILFQNQKKVSTENLTLWLKNLGIDDEVIKNCQSSKSILEKIKDDIEVGQKLGVDSTPTLYINGRKFIGRGFPSMRQEVLRLLR